MSEDVRTYLTHALRIVDETGAWIRERVRTEFRVETKEDASFVTEIDLEVERRIRDGILSRWPGHSVIGEEHGSRDGASDYRWTIDPIDGTMSLRSGVPLFGTIVALHRGTEPLVGIIQLPALERCYWAGRNLGTQCNGRLLHLRDTESTGSEIIALGDRAQFVRTGLEDVFDELMKRHKWARTYTDAFGHAMAIEGAVGAMIDVDLKVWDVGATQLLITEAGGRFERLEGQPDRWNVVFGKPHAVNWILELIESLEEQSR